MAHPIRPRRPRRNLCQTLGLMFLLGTAVSVNLGLFVGFFQATRRVPVVATPPHTPMQPVYSPPPSKPTLPKLRTANRPETDARPHAVQAEPEHIAYHGETAATTVSLSETAAVTNETAKNDSHPLVAALHHHNTPYQKSTTLPQWMKDYFDWHSEQRPLVTPTSNHRFLVMRCSHKDKTCGGLSDRLKPLPYALLLASQSRRLLLIDWERPAPLTEFLVPNGLDWTPPDWMDFHWTKRTDIWNLDRSDHVFDDTQRIVDMRVQDTQGGLSYYRQFRPVEEFAWTYRETWKVLFRPSPAVQERIDGQLAKLGLERGRYVAAHSRLLYKKQVGPNEAKQRVENAVQCAAQLQASSSELPVFVASDSKVALEAAVAFGAKEHRQVVARLDEPEPLHLDKGADYLAPKMVDVAKTQSQIAADYYDVFVDLYLLAESRCVAYDVGGYGRWGSMLSHEPSCTIDHLTNKCTWTGNSKKDWTKK